MMRKTKLMIALAGLLMAATSCTKEASSGGTDPSDGDVEVHFSTGSTTTATRAANPFAVNTPVKLLVYQRGSDGLMNLTKPAYKTAEGVTSTTVDGLSTVEIKTIDNVAITASTKLTVKSGKTYDFVILVNSPKADPLKPSVGAINGGVMGGISHGVDLLAGRKEEVIVPVGSAPINITFRDNGADTDGNLPHLASNIAIQGMATQGLLDFIHNGNAVANPLKMSVVGADFRQCLPEVAILPFSSPNMALAVQGNGNRSSYSMKANSSPKVMTLPADTVYSESGIVLPYPSASGYNSMTIDFLLGVNGAEVILPAEGVEVPAFAPGYRYKFIVELDKNEEGNVINLYVVITKWESLSWDSGMGGSGTDQELAIKVGSWTSVSWGSGMGGNGTPGSMQILSVRGWSAISWISNMGGK